MPSPNNAGVIRHKRCRRATRNGIRFRSVTTVSILHGPAIQVPINADPAGVKRFLVKLFAGAVLVLMAIAAPAFAQSSGPKPTPFEAFALKPVW